jgi:hypothetical protein
VEFLPESGEDAADQEPGGLASAVLSARILCPVGILPQLWKGLRRVCCALEGDGADRNLPILEARPFRGVRGQFLDRHVERNIGQHQHVQRVVGGAPETAAAADDLL